MATSALTEVIECRRALDDWRARVGRMPRGYEERFASIVRRCGANRVERAIGLVAAERFRRTEDRWRLFLAFFGEEP